MRVILTMLLVLSLVGCGLVSVQKKGVSGGSQQGAGGAGEVARYYAGFHDVDGSLQWIAFKIDGNKADVKYWVPRGESNGCGYDYFNCGFEKKGSLVTLELVDYYYVDYVDVSDIYEISPKRFNDIDPC